MKQIFLFNEMVTPKIITFIYWLLLLAIVIGGLAFMFAGQTGSGAINFVVGALIIILGGLGARVYCELMIVLFKIHENIRKLAEK
jgi:hypothetical protein